MESGERIAERYKIIRLIGQGGMAKVYLARDLILDRDVAVKLMAYDFHNDTDSIRRFKREALSTTELVHPNIVNIYDVEEADNPYIVMEYVKGTDLKQYIYDHHPIPYKKSLAIMNQILEAVEYAHYNGVIHRDLKPQNILIDPDGNVKITDFGIAVALSQNSITQTNSLLGSVHYLSPEQARGSMATKQSDIYSLGILLYELLSGDVPFDGESAVSIALKHFQNPLPSIRQIDNRIPQPLENVVLKATAKDSNQRYQTVSEMKEDLKTALSPERSQEPKFVPKNPNEEDTRVIEPIAANSEGKETTSVDPSDSAAPKSAETKPKKKRRWWIWILLLLVLIGGGIGIALLASRPQEVQVPELQGLTQEEAETELEALNLIVGEITEEYSEEFEEEQVTRTEPASGSTIREENEVDLFISLGAEPIELEDYTGEEFEVVAAELEDLNMDLTIEREDESSDDVAAGYIIDQDVDPDEEVFPGETITFTVSTGEAGFGFDDLSGYSRAAVTGYADRNNLSVTIEEEASDDVPEGQVISQEPEAGTTLYSGDQISVVLSTGPEEPNLISFSEQVTIPYEPSEEAADEGEEDEATTEPEAVPNHIQIFIEDAENDGSEAARDFEITEDTQIFLNFTVEEGTEATYRIERDGEVIEEENVSP